MEVAVSVLTGSRRGCTHRKSPWVYSPEVIVGVQVLGGGMTHDFSVVGTYDQRLPPERVRHRLQAERREEVLCLLKHLQRRVVLGLLYFNSIAS